MSTEEVHSQILHVVALPFPAEGHINGMLKLAQEMAGAEEHGIVVTFGYPARFHSLALKRNKLAAVLNSHSTLRVEVLEDGLPLEEERLLPLRERIHICVTVYQNAVKVLLEDLVLRSKSSSATVPLSCIISDTLLPWTQDLANNIALPRVEFCPSTAAAYSMGTQLSLLVSNGTLPLPKSCGVDSEKKWKVEAPLIDCVPGLPPFPVTDFPSGFLYLEELNDPILKLTMDAFGRAREAHTILVHSPYELESQVFDALQANGFPVLALGPFLDSLDVPSSSALTDNANQECIQWLDTQSPNSVVYVALGSIASLAPIEMHALALGLEASGHPFLWVIRLDSISSSLSDALPEGFLQRTVEKGLAHIVSWAPQMEVLHHCAVGAFFSHCGWNSTLESMWEGVPMVACPRLFEQRSNARWIIENWKIGVEVERQRDGSFTKEAVHCALQRVFTNEGTNYKERALQLKQMVRSTVRKGGTSYTNLVNFLNGLRHYGIK